MGALFLLTEPFSVGTAPHGCSARLFESIPQGIMALRRCADRFAAAARPPLHTDKKML
jgi:hypothetical protein